MVQEMFMTIWASFKVVMGKNTVTWILKVYEIRVEK